MEISALIQNILFYATLPGVMGLVCVLVFMLWDRKRGQLMMLDLSAAVSTALLLKEIFKVPRPWLMHIETAPYLAEGGYALPCLHTQLTAAVLCSLVLTSKRKTIRFLCAAGISLTAGMRVFAGQQTLPDVLTGAAVGILIAFLLTRFYFASSQRRAIIIDLIVMIPGLAAALLVQDGWGLGTSLTVLLLDLLEKPMQKAESGRTTFRKIYGTFFAAGLYIGMIIFLPFIVEWFITPLWPGQTLIVFLITFFPCLLFMFI